MSLLSVIGRKDAPPDDAYSSHSLVHSFILTIMELGSYFGVS